MVRQYSPRVGKIVSGKFFRIVLLGVAALGFAFISPTPFGGAKAHTEHGASPDLEIRAGETEDGDLYFRLTFDHGTEVSGALNGPVHIHSGRPHIVKFVNEGELPHEVRFG